MKAIVAVDEEFGIGKNGTIPWHVPADFKWFKEFTMKNPRLLMGVKTYDSLPSPLWGRFINILSRNWTFKGCIAAQKKDGSIEVVGIPISSITPKEADDLCVCGGASIYKQYIPYCKELYITHIVGKYESDTFFPFSQEGINKMFPNKELIRELEGGHKVIKYYK